MLQLQQQHAAIARDSAGHGKQQATFAGIVTGWAGATRRKEAAAEAAVGRETALRDRIDQLERPASSAPAAKSNKFQVWQN